MLCKDKITSIFCIIDDILKEINHSEDVPPLVQACSLSPIQNSKFIILSPSHLSQPFQSSQLSHIKKIFFPYLPYTNDIQTIQEERRIVEQLAKIKYLIPFPKLEKYSVLGRLKS